MRAILLDRDGTLMDDTGYPKDPAEVRLLSGVCKALQHFRALGYLIVVISNQSGVGRGLLRQTDVEAVHARLENLLATGGAMLDAAYYCFDAPEAASEFRKPGIGMLREAQRDFGIDFKASFLIGDKPSDVEAGNAAGCRTIWFRPENSMHANALADADYVAASWAEIEEIVVRNHQQ